MSEGLRTRVLLITYYWPPAGGGGVYRWLKFSKYLPEFGVQPVVYTPQDPDFPVIDESLAAEISPEIEIWQHPIWEPYGYYRQFVGMKRDKKIYSGFITENEKETLRQKVSVFIRGNFFIPDARKFWIRPSIKYLTERLQSDPVDVIITTGPPHSMHRIGLGLKRVLGIPWIADFRDPWTGIDFYDQLHLTPIADRKHHRMEREVLQEADAVVTVSPQWKLDLEKLGGRSVNVITNGYDEADFGSAPPLTQKFTLTHLGSVNADRNVPVLWETLDQFLGSEPEFASHFELHLVGPIDQRIQSSIDQLPVLSKHYRIDPWMDHPDAIRTMQASQVLLLLLNNTPNKYGILPGKLFEYLGAGRPVLCIGPTQGDADYILHECHAGQVIDYQDSAGMLAYLREKFSEFIAGKVNAIPREQIWKFARKQLASDYCDLISTIAKKAVHESG